MKRCVVLLTVLFSVFAFASEPQFVNAKVQVVSASAGLEKTIRGILAQGAGPIWLGYAVPTTSSPRFICCFDSHQRFQKMNGCCSGCRLESSQGSSFNSRGGTCVQGEAPTHVFVLMRAEGGRITKVRPFTPDCALDAANKAVYWLTEVRDNESIALLTLFARGNHSLAALHSRQAPLDAIALHRDPSADAALESFLVPQTEARLREHAAFWIGQERGDHGFEVLRRYMRTDADADFREHLTFAISESEDPEAMAELIRVAHEDRDGDVRGQAIFWMAQKAGSKVAGEISRAIEDDPDTDVKKKAVFALSQLPEQEGVPKLIEVARSNRNPVVRKEAIFWLGQSEDPRALAYIEQVLLK